METKTDNLNRCNVTFSVDKIDKETEQILKKDHKDRTDLKGNKQNQRQEKAVNEVSIGTSVLVKGTGGLIVLAEVPVAKITD